MSKSNKKNRRRVTQILSVLLCSLLPFPSFLFLLPLRPTTTSILPLACAPTTFPCPHPHSTTMKNQPLPSRHNHSKGSLFVLSTKSTGVIAAASIGLAAAARPYGNRMTGQGLLLSLGALQCCWIGANLVTYLSTFALDSTFVR